MSNTKQKDELNVDLIGGEAVSEKEKQELKAFFRKQKDKKMQKRPTKRDRLKKEPVSD